MSQGNSASHTAAYNALSASLASLKNRLNARTVSLGSSDSSTSTAGSSNSYGSGSLSIGSEQVQPNQQTQLTLQQNNVPTSYLSVSNGPHQDNQSLGLSGSQGNENKTIVLAIPAKINFLSDNRSSYAYNAKPYQPSPSSQQLTLIQPSADQYYTAAKGLGKYLLYRDNEIRNLERELLIMFLF